MSDVSLIFIFIGGIMLLKESFDYKNLRIKNRFVEVNRLQDKEAFCRYASHYSLINALIVFGILVVVFLGTVMQLKFDFVLYIILVILFLVRAFSFPRSFERFYLPKTIDDVTGHIDIDEIDEREE